MYENNKQNFKKCWDHENSVDDKNHQNTSLWNRKCWHYIFSVFNVWTLTVIVSSDYIELKFWGVISIFNYDIFRLIFISVVVRYNFSDLQNS